MYKRTFPKQVRIVYGLALFSIVLLLSGTIQAQAGELDGRMTEHGVWPKPNEAGPMAGWSKWQFNLAKKNLHSLKYEQSGAADGGGYIHLESDNDEFWCYTS
ncbi:MAG: hypothetical protein PHQ75_13380, partial [Thermoguttaceae bacterium]|nr:hypothetical protein [Thermoguttaceae bacterium]